MEIGGVTPPAGLYGKSLLPLLQSDKSGQIDPERNWVVTGRERHVARAREDNLPYPMRALRTPDFLYIRNFAPDRWPMGSPAAAAEKAAAADRGWKATPTSPSPTWTPAPPKPGSSSIATTRSGNGHYDFAFAKRPGEELYDLKKDPDQTDNVAADPAYAKQKQELSDRLMKLLTDAGDPRVTGDGKTFDRPPFTDAGEDPQPRKRRKTRRNKVNPVRRTMISVV